MKGVKQKLEELRLRCLAVTSADTASAASDYPGAAEATSDLGKELKSIWDKADFGCQAVNVGRLFHVLLEQATGEKVAFPTRKEVWAYSYPLYSAVVPLVLDNAHNYPLNTPFFVAHKEDSYGQAFGGWREAGEGRGNNHWGAWRYATEAEINKLFADFAEHREVTKWLLAELGKEDE